MGYFYDFSETKIDCKVATKFEDVPLLFQIQKQKKGFPIPMNLTGKRLT